MNLLNIYNQYISRDTYLFCRKEDGTQEIIKDSSFFPFYYEYDDKGKYKGYDGTPLKKVIVSKPSEVRKNRSLGSFASDIQYEKLYLTHKVTEITKAPIRYMFLDIEIQTKELPDIRLAKAPIACISCYDSFEKKISTFWIKDYENETELINSFISYMKEHSPDLFLGWNVSFDFDYLHNRIKNFSKKISPIGQERYGKKDLASQTVYYYPAGISVVDYMALFKKVFMREASYALNNISQKYLNDGDWGETDFSQVTDDIKEKNINDVKRLVKLEEKFNLLAYFDEIRRLTKVQWEDLYHNSAIIESLLFEEAKKMNIVLPNKQENVENTSFQGATRESSKTGALFNIGKYDLESAYPSMIINFCLDFQNIVKPDEKGNENVVEIDGLYFKQNPNTLVPNMVREILTLKNNLKKELAEHPSEELKLKYNAIKAVANSAFGAFGNQYFRLYDNRITSSITYLVRDLLMYTKDELEKKNIETVYWDTDSIFADTTVDILPMLNETIQKWGKEKYNKDSIALKYDYEGYFEKLFLLAKCRYIGYLNKKGKGKIEQEVKGLEVKRVSSAKFEGQFQEKLIDMILDKKSREEVEDFILEQKKALKKAPLEDIAFPIKLSSIVYKGNPIQKRCLDNSRIVFKDMKIGVGEVFYYIFVKGYGYDKSNKEINVLAFKKGQDIIPREKVDFEEMIRRNIDAKVTTVFEAMKWVKSSDERQGRLF